MRIAEIFPSLGKSGSRNTMVTTDLRVEVEISWLFCACNASSHNYRNSSVIVDVAMG